MHDFDAVMAHAYPVHIAHIFISPGHNYFGKAKDGAGNHPTTDVAEVAARAGRGLVGDRFFAVPAHYDAQVTFIAGEVFDALRAAFDRADLSPIHTRRNIVIYGANLNQLIGRPFALSFDDHTIEFSGVSHCSPCGWMDAAVIDGAQKFLRGRGGLRARIETDGVIRRGPATLLTDAPLDVTTLTQPRAKPRLP